MTKNRISAAGYYEIQSSEAFSSVPYLCSAGVPSIGFGNTVYPSGKRVTMQDKPITYSQATELFMWSLEEYENAVNEVLPDLEQHEFDALVNLCYNIGVNAFKKSTLVKTFDRKDGLLQEAEQIMRWNKVNGKPSKGLTNRRRRERAMFLGIEVDDD